MSSDSIKILPSLLAADFGRLADAVGLAEAAGADGLHLDIMDGHFVRNLSMGPDVVKMARKRTRLPLSVHLMVTRPDVYAEPFIQAGADTLLIHVEAACNPVPVLKNIRAKGIRAGITLNPETPAAAIQPLLDYVDEALFMTVHPGFGGQAFIAGVLPKMAAIRALAPDLDISVDGGIDEDTAEASAARGANIFLVGSTLYQAPDMSAKIRAMRARIEKARRSFSPGGATLP